MAALVYCDSAGDDGQRQGRSVHQKHTESEHIRQKQNTDSKDMPERSGVFLEQLF